MQPRPRTVRPTVPATGSMFLDARGGDRALRLSWHHDADMVVLSLWRGNVCSGTFRLAIGDVPALVEALRAGSAGLQVEHEYAAGDDDRRTG